MQKIDFKKELKHLYRPATRKIAAVDVPSMNFLMIDGEGGPNAPAFGEAIEALYPLSYALKFMVKRGEMEIDYGVMPLEGLWWADDMTVFTSGDKSQWKWTLMIMQPEFISRSMGDEATDAVMQKKQPDALPRVRFESFTEGRAVQTMHVGPFSEEGPTIEKLHAAIEELDCSRSGKHHEIYLSDMRRAAPEKWRTVLRQPMG